MIGIILRVLKLKAYVIIYLSDYGVRKLVVLAKNEADAQWKFNKTHIFTENMLVWEIKEVNFYV